MTCEQVRSSAAGLASLDNDDPDRLDAYGHARSCHSCARALAEGERLLGLIDALPAPAAPSAAVLRRVAEEIHAEIEAERRAAAARPEPLAAALPGATVPARAPVPARALKLWPARPVALAAASVVVVAFAALIVRIYHRPVAPTIWIEALAVVGLAAAGAALCILKRSPWIPAGLLGVSIGFALLRGHGDGIGAHDCTVLELVASSMALVPAGILVALRRVPGGAVTLAGMAAAGALAGQAALDVLCIGSAWLPHLLVFHTGGVVVAMLVGVALAQLPPWRAAARA